MINRYGWYSNLFHLHIEIKVKAQDQDEWMWNSLNVAVSKLNAIRISFDHFVRQMRTGSVHWQIVYGSAWSDLDAFTMLFICSLKASHKLTIQFNYIIFLFDVSNAKRQECQASKNVCWNIKMQSGCSSCDPFIVISVILPAETSFCDSQRLLSLSNDITLCSPPLNISLPSSCNKIAPAARITTIKLETLHFNSTIFCCQQQQQQQALILNSSRLGRMRIARVIIYILNRVTSTHQAIVSPCTRETFFEQENRRDSTECEKRCSPVYGSNLNPLARFEIQSFSSLSIHVFTVLRCIVCAANFRHDSWSWSLARYQLLWPKTIYICHFLAASIHSQPQIFYSPIRCWCLRFEIASSAIQSLFTALLIHGCCKWNVCSPLNCTHNQCAKRIK